MKKSDEDFLKRYWDKEILPPNGNVVKISQFTECIYRRVLNGDLLYAVNKDGLALIPCKALEGLIASESENLLKRCLNDLRKEMQQKQSTEIKRAVDKAMKDAFAELIKCVAKKEA